MLGGDRAHAWSTFLVVSRIFRTLVWAERHPSVAQAVMAPLICWSFSSPMFRYLLLDHAVPATWRSGEVQGRLAVGEGPDHTRASVIASATDSNEFLQLGRTCFSKSSPATKKPR